MVKYEMVTPDTTSTLDVTSHEEVTSSNISSGSKSLILPITQHKLSEDNYLQWSHSVMLFICRKRKDNFLTKEATTLSTKDLKHHDQEIEEDFMYYKTTKEIWDTAKETYSNNDNTS